MSLEPRHLKIPLYKREWAHIYLPLLAGMVGWLWHRPFNFADAVASYFIGGAAVWVAFASPLSWWLGTHRMPIVRALWVVTCVVGLVWFMRNIAPYVHGLV